MNQSEKVSIGAKVKHYWLLVKKVIHVLSASFWFVPSILIALAAVAAISLEHSDLHSKQFTQYLGWLKTDSASTSLQLLQIIASSVITVTSIAFSMTLVALTMASSQFGPRLLGRFMQDKRTQFVLGMFTATFIYCLLVMAQISITDSVVVNPVTSVAIAKLLAIICVFVLIYFIHHVAISISADHIIETVYVNLMKDLDAFKSVHERLRFEEKLSLANIEMKQKQILLSSSDGYLQAIDYEGITDLAKNIDVVIQLNVHAGNYLIQGQQIAECIHERTGNIEIDINPFLVIGAQRTSLQDPVFAINQLVEMALRALSPSLNDPFTAINCVNRIATAFCSFTKDNMPKRLILDNNQTARVFTDEPTLGHIFNTTFDKLRQDSHDNVSLLVHLLKTFQKMLDVKSNDTLLQPGIIRQTKIIKDVIQQQQFAPKDNANLNELIDTILDYIDHS